MAAFEAGAAAPEDRMRAVEQEFVRAGLTLCIPYLEPQRAAPLTEKHR
jgi:hypothetical protein